MLSAISAFSSTATTILVLGIVVAGGPQNQRNFERMAATADRVANVEARVIQIDQKLDLSVIAFDKKLDVILLQLRATGAIPDDPSEGIEPVIGEPAVNESARPPG